MFGPFSFGVFIFFSYFWVKIYPQMVCMSCCNELFLVVLLVLLNKWYLGGTHIIYVLIYKLMFE